MRDFFRTKIFIFLLVAAILCVGTIGYTAFTSGSTSLASNITGLLITPLQKGVGKIADFFDSIYSYIYDFNTLKEENEQLQSEVREKDELIRENEQLSSENARLREMLDLKQKNRSFDLEMAEIIGVSTGNWSTVFTIDKGSISGIEENDCVITEDGMVGYVSEVGATFAEVITVIDPEMQAGAIVSRTRDVAVAQGTLELMEDGKLKLSYIKRENDIMVGDTVETSGLGEVFPKGILIGTIEQILPESHGISNYAIVEPVVDLNDISTVFVIKSFEITE